MKNDITSRKDIEQLVNTFYDRVSKDERLGYIFNEVAAVNWNSHLEIMYRFWENIILFTGDYSGNPMNLHQHIHHLKPLEGTDFDKWNRMFIETVDDLFEGRNAEGAKERALCISDVLKSKIISGTASEENIY